MRRSRFIALGEGDALVHPTSWAQDEARLHACDGECSSKFQKDYTSHREIAELLTALHVGQRRYTRVPSDLTLFFFPLQKSQSIHPMPSHPSHATASSLEQFTRRPHGEPKHQQLLRMPVQQRQPQLRRITSRSPAAATAAYTAPSHGKWTTNVPLPPRRHLCSLFFP